MGDLLELRAMCIVGFSGVPRMSEGDQVWAVSIPERNVTLFLAQLVLVTASKVSPRLTGERL